jgi:uncharacterized protein DUF4115
MAGRHRKVSHRRGRHRKPPSPARLALPVGTGIAVVAVAVVALTHGDAHGSPPQHLAPAVVADDVAPSVLGFHTSRPLTPSSPVADHHALHVHPATKVDHHARQPAHHRSPAGLRIRATSDCYVQVTTTGGKLLLRRILHHHDHVQFRRHHLDVVLGNAGGVVMSVNGRPAHRAGSSGQVRRFRTG